MRKVTKKKKTAGKSKNTNKVQKVTTTRRFSTKEAKYDAFCMSFIQHWNATQAAIEVGAPKKSAYQQGYEYLRKPEIQKKLQELQAKALAKSKKSDEDIIVRLEEIAFGDPEKVKYLKYRDVVKSLELLGRRFGLFPTHSIERHDVVDWAEIYKAAEKSGLFKKYK